MPEPVEPELSRREFLAVLGASAALAAGCSRPERGGIAPFAQRPPGARPGKADLYASAFQEGLAAHPVLVRTREGRPILVQGNDRHAAKAPLRAIADLLGLYGPERLRRPSLDWPAAQARLLAAVKGGKPVLLLSGALMSPTRRALLKDLERAWPKIRHVAWEPVPERDSRFRLERARVILALEAELLAGDRPGEIDGFAAHRSEDSMSRLYAFEGGMSLTGAKADHRVPWKPSRAAALGFALARTLHRGGLPLPAGFDASALSGFDLDALAAEQGADPALLRVLVEDLRAAGRSAAVAAGPSLPPAAQAAARLLNVMLGAAGHTVDYSRPAESLASNEELARVLEEAARDRFGAAIFWGVNPAYAFPDAGLWKKACSGIPFKARIALRADETAADCGLVLPEHHWLESWNDFEPAADLLVLQQPAVRPLYETRQAEDVLLALAGSPAADYRHYLMRRWQREVQPAASPVPFERFWAAALHDGVLARPDAPRPARPFDGALAARLARTAAPAAAGFELILAPAANLHDGRYSDNPWLQELPDPVTKLCWGNAVSVSPADASRLGLADGDMVRLSAGGRAAELPALVQPGQAPGVLNAALGYGRGGIGTNLYPLLGRGEAALKKTGRRAALPFLQRHHRLEGRDAARRLSAAEARRPRLTRPKDLASLHPELKFPARKWGMVVDLSRCTGCQACMAACQCENNVAVVGPEQVLKGREMHWLRVDRYYEGPEENPRVLLQPMLCQQCDHAPCETVCPVAATNHSDEGLNQMAYNRCVGTRYCMNNCPYKVRRFNFFEYNARLPESRRLAFNPEVTVRPRGVMEKCTFCVQRIQEAKAAAKAEGRPLRDGDVKPACAAACPAQAIVFGDLKDPQSRVARLAAGGRGYRVLEELGVRPAVTYLADLSNPVGGADAP